MRRVGRIVHLGLGNFHRAHQAVYTQDAGMHTGERWRVTGVSFRNRALVEALRAQQGRYTVLEVGPGAAPPRTVDVIDEALVAADDTGVKEYLYQAGTQQPPVEALGSPTVAAS